MRLLRELRKLPALPLMWIGNLLLMFKQSPAAAALFKAAFAVGGDPQAALSVWAILAQRQQVQQAREFMLKCWAARPQPEFAGALGLMAIDVHDLAAAGDYLARGRALGGAGHDLLDLLEFNAALRGGNPETVTAVVARFAGRRDLPATLTRSLLATQMVQAEIAGDLPTAERIARRILQVEALGEPCVLVWALAERDGLAAPRDCAAAVTALPAGRRLHLQFVALRAVGLADRARAALEELRQIDAARAEQIDREFGLREAQA